MMIVSFAPSARNVEAFPESLMLFIICSTGASPAESASRPRTEAMVETVRDALRPMMMDSVGLETVVGLKVSFEAMLVAVLLRFIV